MMGNSNDENVEICMTENNFKRAVHGGGSFWLAGRYQRDGGQA